jgi:hypothetical protein
MAVRTISDFTGSVAVMYCSTTDWAFGPLFYDEDDHSGGERIQSFLRWLQVDARAVPETVLERLYLEWKAQEKEQWAREDAEVLARENE